MSYLPSVKARLRKLCSLLSIPGWAGVAIAFVPWGSLWRLVGSILDIKELMAMLNELLKTQASLDFSAFIRDWGGLMGLAWLTVIVLLPERKVKTIPYPKTKHFAVTRAEIDEDGRVTFELRNNTGLEVYRVSINYWVETGMGVVSMDLGHSVAWNTKRLNNGANSNSRPLRNKETRSISFHYRPAQILEAQKAAGNAFSHYARIGLRVGYRFHTATTRGIADSFYYEVHGRQVVECQQ